MMAPRGFWLIDQSSGKARDWISQMARRATTLVCQQGKGVDFRRNVGHCSDSGWPGSDRED